MHPNRKVLFLYLDKKRSCLISVSKIKRQIEFWPFSQVFDILYMDLILLTFFWFIFRPFIVSCLDDQIHRNGGHKFSILKKRYINIAEPVE